MAAADGDEREPIFEAVLGLFGGRGDRVAVGIARRVANLFEPAVRRVVPKGARPPRIRYEMFYRLVPKGER